MLNTAEICCRRRRVMFKEAQNKKFETRAPGFLRQLKKKKKKRSQTVGPGTYIRSRKKRARSTQLFFFKFLFIVAIP